MDMASALTASSAVVGLLSVDHEARDIGLKLDKSLSLGLFIVFAASSARRQRHLVGFVYILGHHPTMVIAVILAAHACRLLPFGFAFLAHRDRLAFDL